MQHVLHTLRQDVGETRPTEEQVFHGVSSLMTGMGMLLIMSDERLEPAVTLTMCTMGCTRRLCKGGRKRVCMNCSACFTSWSYAMGSC